MYFSNRKEAGKRLGYALSAYKSNPDTIILALPRGGVPVAFEVAQMLHLPLDLILVRKLGVPENEELAMGAISMGNIVVLNDDIIREFYISPRIINRAIEHEKIELMRRNNVYRGGRPAPDIKHKTVILIDDGMATGANMRAAIQAIQKQEVSCIIVAIPVASSQAYAALETLADKIVCLDISEPFYGVGHFYQDFSQTNDEEVKALLIQTTQARYRKVTASHE